MAPAGRLGTIQNVIQIVPQVAGQVVEVPVKPNTPVRRGDVLFRIEPRPYQYQVDKLEAVLAAAGVNVNQLRERLSGAEAGVEQARAPLERLLDRRLLSPSLHAEAAGALCRIGAPRGPEGLRRVLRAFRPDGRSRAAELAGELGLRELLPELRRLRGRARGVDPGVLELALSRLDPRLDGQAASLALQEGPGR